MSTFFLIFISYLLIGPVCFAQDQSELIRIVEAIKRYAGHQSIDLELKKAKKLAQEQGLPLSDYLSPNQQQALVQRGQNEASQRKKTCTNRDLRQKNRLSERPRHQGDTGWCYAFAAADLLTYHLGEEVSAIDIAANYIKYRRGGITRTQRLLNYILPNDELAFDSGNLNLAVQLTGGNGFCLESDLPSEDYKDFVLSAQALNEMRNFFDEFKSYNSINPFRSYTPEQYLLIENQCSLGANYIRNLFPELKVSEIVETLAGSRAHNFWYNLIDLSCQRFLPSRALKVISDTPRTAQNLISAIDSQLNKEGIVAINYDANVFFDPYTLGRNNTHASTIVSRRFNTEKNRCEYLVRNTYGSDDAFYNESFEVDNGHVWISEGAIANITNSIDYIDP